MEHFYRQCHYSESKNLPLVIDLTGADYIELAALPNIIATVVDRKENGEETSFLLPQSRSVRDFLKVWRFPEAIAAATQTPFKEFLTLKDKGFLSEKQNTYLGIGNAIDDLEFDSDWTDDSPTKRNFFEFTTISEEKSPISPIGSHYSAPKSESLAWASRLVRQVLKKHLDGKTEKDDIGRVVIYESMSNAVRHPQAKIIQIVSKFDRKRDAINNKRKKGSESKGFLRICVWDDGEAITDVLLRLLDEGKPISSNYWPSYLCEKIKVNVRNFENKLLVTEIVDQADEITREKATEARVLLASLFPGVSRCVAEPVPHTEHPDDLNPKAAQSDNSNGVDESTFSSAPGWGLFSLTKVVLDQYRGNLLIRSGNHRLYIKGYFGPISFKENARYNCKITKYPKVYYPKFRGNLFVINIPVRSLD